MVEEKSELLEVLTTFLRNVEKIYKIGQDGKISITEWGELATIVFSSIELTSKIKKIKLELLEATTEEMNWLKKYITEQLDLPNELAESIIEMGLITVFTYYRMFHGVKNVGK